MKVETVSYKRIKSLGNYQSATLEMTVQISEGEDVEVIARELQNTIEDLLDVPRLSEFSKPPVQKVQEDVQF